MNQQLAKLIESFELELLRPEVRKSVEKLNDLLADDFLEFGMSGLQYNKQDIIKLLISSTDTKYEGLDFAAKELAPDTVLLTYRSSTENLRTGKKQWTLRSSIWKKLGKNWQMIFHQGTPQLN